MHENALALLLEFAVDIAVRAGRSTLAHFQSGTDVELKSDASPVTVADRQAERLLRERIEQHFPADGIVGEEFGETRAAARRRWILDPIDGTRAFIRGVPLYGTLVAVEEAGEPLVGVIHLPAMGETVCAAAGEGCWWNGRRARVSAVNALRDALVVTSDASSMASQGRSDAWSRICDRVQITRTWGDCYGYALVATGRAEAMIDPILSIWDAAAMVPIIQEAGGVVTDFAGRSRHDTGNLIATNSRLAGDLRELLEDPHANR
jgi:histidinol phosphatase-like enzyme (inositol monophosphatase family)